MPIRRAPALAVGLVTLGLLVAACGGGGATPAPTTAPAASVETTPVPSSPPTDAPSASSAAGRTGRIEIASEKVALTLPDNWVEVNLTAGDIDTILGAYPAGSFTEAQLALMKSAVQSGMKLMAFDQASAGSNVNLLVQPAAISIDLLEPAVAAQLEAVPGTTDIKVNRGTAGGQDALFVTYGIKDPSTGAGMSGTQAYVSTNGRLYVLTVTLQDGSSASADDIVGSLEFLP
ncbi:MAG: hypothetical protein ABIR11_13405 [Candidatus Limnocylindrales bacterium]